MSLDLIPAIYGKNITTGFLSALDWAGKSFPFDGGAADVTIAGATTWNDAKGYKQVGVLTINAGITLRILRFPFYIFAREIVFGDTASIIDANGPDGLASGSHPSTVARGGEPGGGCGGGLLIVCAGRISGAAGTIRANGGAANAAAGSQQGGQGAFSQTAPGSTSSSSYENWGSLQSGTPPHPLGLFLGDGGSASAEAGNGGTGGGSGKRGSGSASYAGGGSGIGGGGAVNTGAQAGKVALVTPGPLDLLALAAFGCRGGGGGATAGSHAGGGGGGGLAVFCADFVVTPVVQANGGAAAGTAGVGGAGVAYTVPIK